MQINHDFSRLTLISSAGCNLSCKYCVINQNKTSINYSNKMQHDIITSFQNNTFLETVKNIYTFFNQDFNIVKEIDLWGQEPTTTLKFFTEKIENWIQVFPNIKKFFFSTNMGNDPLIIYNFIDKLDNIMTTPCEIHIQISYDGNYSCLNQRNIDPQLIKNNYTILINKLNNKIFKNIKVFFSTHGVINFETINDLINNDNLFIDFLKDIDETETYMFQIVQNINCVIFKGADFVLEQPYDASSNDGIILTLFLQKIKILSKSLELKNSDLTDKILSSLQYRCMCKMNWRSLLSKSLKNYKDKTDFFNSFLSCGTNVNELKITYDGKILHCLNYIFNTELKYLNDSNKNEFNLFQNLINCNYYIEPLKDSKENIHKIFDIYDNINLSFLTTYSSTLNLMNLLVNSNQIDISYKYNKEKILRHSFYITAFQYCIYNRLIKSNSHYLTNTGICRLFGNGLLDLLDNYILEQRMFYNE